MKRAYPFILLSILLLLFLSLDNNQDQVELSIYEQGGFVLSFDDNYVENWYSISELFERYNSKVTFFVSGFSNLNLQQISLLNELKEKGHEIASHTLNHIDALEYLDSNSLDAYIGSEIDPEIGSMKSHGFNPSTFSYPFGFNNADLDSALLNKFSLLRDVTEYQRHFYSMFFTSPEKIDEIFIGSNESKVLKGLGIDQNYNISIEDIDEIFKRASDYKEIVILYCHDPVSKVLNDFQIQIDYLESLLKLADKHNLKSYRFVDLNNKSHI